MNLIVRPGPEAEIADAVDWYLNEAGQGLAKRISNATKSAIAEIMRSPFLFRIHEDGMRRKFVKGFPYSILYSVEGEEIIVTAFMHQSREPGYWQKRG